MRVATSWGNRATRITITTAVQKSTRLAVLLLVQDFLKYSCAEPMHRNAIEASNSQRLYCRAQRLKLASPTAPRNPKARQQASVQSAAKMAAAGAPFSETFIYLH